MPEEHAALSDEWPLQAKFCIHPHRQPFDGHLLFALSSYNPAHYLKEARRTKRHKDFIKSQNFPAFLLIFS